MSHLDLTNCTLMHFEEPEYSHSLYNPDLTDSLQGGLVYVGGDSSLSSQKNFYLNARAHTGGCVAVVGSGSRAVFNHDYFTNCSADIGGALYAIDFKGLEVYNSDFEKNIAFQGQGANIFGTRYTGEILLENVTMLSFHNAVYLEEGNDIRARNLTLRETHNAIENGRDTPTYHFNLSMNDTRPFLEDTEVYGTGDLNRPREDEEKEAVDLASLTGEQQRAARAAEALRQATKYIIRSQQNYQRYSGGFHFLNMKRISEFRDVRMKGLKGEYGGCISIELD